MTDFAASRTPLLVVTFALVVAHSHGARAFCRSTTSGSQPDPTVCPETGVPVAWAGRCVSLSIDPRNVPAPITADSFRSEVAAAFARWSAVSCGAGGPSIAFVAYPDCSQGAGWLPNGRNANTVSFRTTWGDDAFHVPGAMAVTITTFAASTGELRDSDTELNLQSTANPTGYTFTTGAATPGAADLPTILTHELGHTLGLAHTPDAVAVMWSRAGLGEQRRVLGTDDIAGVCAVYPPGRSAACQAEPRGGFACAQGCACSAAPGAGARTGEWALVVGAALGAAARSRRRLTRLTRRY